MESSCGHWDLGLERTNNGLLVFCRWCGKGTFIPWQHLRQQIDGEDYEQPAQGARLSPRTPSGGEGAEAWTPGEPPTLIWNTPRVPERCGS
jgi:hypothetical protein